MKSGLIAALVAAGFCVQTPDLSAAGPDDGKKAGDGHGADSPRTRGGDSRKEGAPARERARARLDALLKEHPEADTDKDGKLSAAEAREWAREHRPLPEGKRLEAFLKRNPEADKDKDGKLSVEEFRAYLKEHGRANLPGASERLGNLLKEHPEADKDKDGKLSPAEIREWRKEHPPAKTPQGAKTPERKKTEEV